MITVEDLEASHGLINAVKVEMSNIAKLYYTCKTNATKVEMSNMAKTYYAYSTELNKLLKDASEEVRNEYYRRQFNSTKQTRQYIKNVPTNYKVMPIKKNK